MADDSEANNLINGTQGGQEPIELSVDLPQSPGTRIYLRLYISNASLMLFLTNAGVDGGTSGAAMGSLVYAMPDRYNPTNPISTALYSFPSSIDLTTRMAKMLVRRTNRVCYVGGNISLADPAGVSTVEEELAALRAIIDLVTSEVAKETKNLEGR